MSNARCLAKALSDGRNDRPRRLSSALILLGSIALAFALPPTARADKTITVSTLADEATAGDGLCSLREAIANANSASDTSGGDCAAGTGNDRIVFGVGGTITLTGTLPPVVNSLTIDGAGQAIAIDGARAYQVLVVNSAATLVVDNLTVEGGFSPGGGGGIENNGGTLTVTNSTFFGNYAGYGGGIENDSGSLTVTNSTFSNNGALGWGGAISGSGTIINSIFSNNGVVAQPGPVFHTGGAISGGTLTITNSVFSNNAVRDGAGGAIYGDATVTNCTFSGNVAFFSGDGGAIAGTATVTNSTFRDNSAWFEGGAINGSATVTSSTFSGNSASSGGAIAGSDFTVSNSILSGSTSGGNCGGLYVPPTITNEGFNISDDGTCGFGSATGANGTIIGDNVDPLLDPNGLQDNGGPTETIALQSASPAIDAIPLASCPATDQRGYTRPDEQETACDIGAYESGATSSSAKLRLNPSTGSFHFKANFEFAGSTNPLTEDVILGIGTYSVTIAAGSFTVLSTSDVFRGTISGVSLRIKIIPQADGSYSVKVHGTGADLGSVTNPVLVTVTIGGVSSGQLVTIG